MAREQNRILPRTTVGRNRSLNWFGNLADGIYVVQISQLDATGFTWNMDIGQPDSGDLDNFPDASHTIPH